MVQEARVRQADSVVMAAARQMHSELLSTKHAVEDELVAFVLDCERCGPAGPLDPRRWVRARPLGALGASAGRSPAAAGARARWRRSVNHPARSTPTRFTLLPS
jgi:hypothetical protein